MPETDTATARIQPGDLSLALGLLTRLPLPVAGDPARGARAAWAWPLAGAVVGGIGALTLWLSTLLGLPTGVTAALALTAMIVVTGALHEDGLADCADGFWGGWTRDRRLEIMRDSRIGTYGVVALVLALLTRWSLIGAALGTGAGAVLIAAAMLSRAPMAAILATTPPARADGLARSLGRMPRDTAWLAAGLAALVGLVLVGWAAIVAALTAYGAAWAVAALARAKIGGQSGDVLGASQQMAEIAALATLVTLLA